MKYFFSLLTILISLQSPIFAAYEGAMGELVDRMVARVNDTAITLSELDEAVVERRLTDPDAAQMSRRQLYEEELARLIDDESIYQAARRSKIDAPAEMISARVKEIVATLEKGAGSKERLDDFLAEQGLTREKLQQLITRREEKQIVIYRAISSRYTLTEADVKEFEDELRSRGNSPVGYQLRHILIKCPQNAPAQVVSQTRERAYKAAVAAQNEMTFEEAAAKFSEDFDTSIAGGSLGYVSEGSMMPELEKTVRAMNLGEISQPVRTEQGWHVLKLENLRSARKLLSLKRFEEERSAMIAQLRRTQTIETQMEFLKSIPDSRPATMPGE